MPFHNEKTIWSNNLKLQTVHQLFLNNCRESIEIAFLESAGKTPEQR